MLIFHFRRFSFDAMPDTLISMPPCFAAACQSLFAITLFAVTTDYADADFFD